MMNDAGQIAALQSSILERKDSLHKAAKPTDMDGAGAKVQNLGRCPTLPAACRRVGSQHPKGAVPLTKRESMIETTLRLATALAKTDCTVLVLTQTKFDQYLEFLDPRVEELIKVTMGASTSKNLREIPFLEGLSDRKIDVLSNMLHYVPLKYVSLMIALHRLSFSHITHPISTGKATICSRKGRWEALCL